MRVRTTARLHLGFLDLNGGLGRRFGSIGLSIDGPETVVTLRRAPHDNVTGEERPRAARYLARISGGLNVAAGHALHVAAAIPPHSGLGSGTQLALAIAAAVRRLHGLDQDFSADAALLGRGARSGIGIALFRAGGFVLDGGRADGTATPPLLARLPVPPEWRVLLIRDPARRGLSGAPERAAFAGLPPMRPDEADRICRLVLMQALPALAERNLARFGDAVSDIQRRVGAYFAPAQDGSPFVSQTVAAALERLAAAGATGLGQTSWGPTGFAFASSAADAERLSDLLRRDADAALLDVSIRRPLNRGAAIDHAPSAAAIG